MRIVQINTFINGSTGKLASAIHEYLLKNGVDSYFFYGIGKTKSDRCVCFESRLSVHFHSLMSRLTGLQGYFSFFATKNLIKRLKALNPDIIHLHNFHGSYLNFKLFLKYISKNNKRLVITLHDCCLFTGKCPHFTKIGCEKWKTECHNCPQLKRYPTSFFFDFTRKIFNDKKRLLLSCKNVQIVTVSHWLKSVTSESFLKHFTITCIPNGVDFSKYRPINTKKMLEKYRILDKKIILGVGTKWSINKGLNSIIHMSEKLQDNEVIVLLGMPYELSLKMPRNIIGIPRTESVNELCELYTNAIALFTMSLEETFGLVVIEAMACNTPAVAFNSTALTELIDNGNNGFLVPIDDGEHFLDAIRKCVLLKNSSSVIRNKAHQRFSIDLMLNKYIDLYYGFDETK